MLRKIFFPLVAAIALTGCLSGVGLDNSYFDEDLNKWVTPEQTQEPPAAEPEGGVL